MTDEKPRSRLEELAGKDKNGEKFVYYISLGIAGILLVVLTTMMILNL